MKNYLLALAALALLSTQTSCKKDKDGVQSCKLASYGIGGQSIAFTYDEAGFVKRTTAPASYYNYDQNGNLLTRTEYNNAGVQIGTPKYYTLNADGLVTVVPNSPDTTYFSYNSEGRLAELIRRNDTIITRTVFTYQDGDVSSSIEYNGDSTVKTTNVYEYYTDKINYSNLNILFDLLDTRYGKPARHFLKQVTRSSSGSLEFTNFYYTYDDKGNAVTLQIVRQPSNSLTNLVFTYLCD